MTNMKVIYTLYVLVASLTSVLCGIHPDGISKVSRSQDALGNYQFSYSVSNSEGEHFRNEGTDHLGRVVGSYGLSHSDGTQRVVDYVADKDGFRAQVRSNEPGVASSDPADVPILKPHPAQPLDILSPAASSRDDSGEVFGARLKTDTSKVSYVDEDQDRSSRQRASDNSARESRQRNFDDRQRDFEDRQRNFDDRQRDFGDRQRNFDDRQRDFGDYRPQSPVAYYPGDIRRPSAPLRPPIYRANDVPVVPGSEPQTPTAATKPPDAYYPPINPHNAVRRPPYYVTRPTDSTILSTITSRRPFTPPYGGFDDDPSPVERRPGISMSTIHGGLNSDPYRPTQAPTPAYGAGRYPSDDSPTSQDFFSPRFPYRPNYLSNPRFPSSLLPPPRRSDYPDSFFSPPSYDSRLRPQKFVLRAVPIPNGIQAVRVDANTGQVYDRLIYPLYLKQDGYPDYDRRILIHNDDVGDDDIFREDSPGYFDIPFPRRPSLRFTRNQPFDENDDYGERSRQYNRSYAIDERSLSKPTAKELDWIRKQIAAMEGLTRNQSPSRPFSNNIPVENPEYPEFDDFDETVSDPQTRNANSPYSRQRFSSMVLSPEAYPRNPRHSEGLLPADTNESAKLEESESKSQISEESKASEIEKE